MDNSIMINLTPQEIEDINGGVAIPWGTIGKYAIRAAVGAAGIGAGAGLAITGGLLIYEACDALGVF